MAVFRRKDRGNKFYYRFTLNGQRYKGCIPGARTKDQAELAEAKIKEEIFQRKFRLRDEYFCNFVDTYYVDWAKLNKPSSWEVHDRFLIPRIKEYFKKKTLKEITVGDVEKFKMYIQRLKTERGKERSSASVNKHLVLLSSILTRAVENEILLSNPARSVSKLPEHNERIANLTYESEKTLFDVIKVSEYHGYMKEIVLVAIGTGMRKSEILKLTWDRVDFEQRQIHLLSKSTKNRKERFIPISEPVLQCLK